MALTFDFDAYAPAQIAARVDTVGVNKARLPVFKMLMLGILAGAFIGLGALYFVVVKSDPAFGYAAGQLVGGLVFSLGLLLVVVAGAELFTGNNLLAMAWAHGRISTAEILKNWLVVCFGNFIGATGLAVLVYWSGHTGFNDGAIANTYIAIAKAKVSIPFAEAFFRGVLCNVLVCLAVWMAFAGHSVTDKAVAIVLPISGFVAAGFEHCVANMYFLPMGMLLAPEAGIDAAGYLRNMVPVILGNLVGGSGLVGLVYYVIYVRESKEST